MKIVVQCEKCISRRWTTLARGLLMLAVMVMPAFLSGCGGSDSDSGSEQASEASQPDSQPTTTIGEQTVADLPVSDLPAIGFADFVSRQSETADRFVELPAADCGIDLVNTWNPPEYHRNLVNPVFGTGVAIGDFDGDGLQDVFVTRQMDAGRLYRNLGSMKFEDVTEQVGIDPKGMWGTGTTFVDINNDGWLDLYICGFDCPNRLYLNDGGKSFTEQAKEYGLDFSGASVVMTFSDYDRDGDLDGYLVTNFLRPEKPIQPRVARRAGQAPQVALEQREQFFFVKKPSGEYAMQRGGQFDHFYRNDGGRFVEASVDSGIGQHPYFGHSATWWDYNDDGWPDLYVANDYKGPDFLYRNNGPNAAGDVTFTNVIEEAMPHTPWYSMGSDFADINNDGLLDYFASDMAGTNHYRDKLSMGSMSGPDSVAWFLNASDPPQYMRNAVYLNTGTSKFMEVAFLTGLAKSDWTWTTKFADLNNDGKQDVFFTNGMTRDLFNSDLKNKLKKLQEAEKAKGENSRKMADVAHDFWEQQEPFRLENMAFRNAGDLEFKAVGRDWGLDHLGVSTGSAVGDLDNDGDLDLIVCGFDEPVRVYRNELAGGGALRVKLIGRHSNRMGLGAMVRLKTGEGEQVRYATSARGFMSSSEPLIHFGFEKESNLKSLSIAWPSGTRQTIEDISPNRLYTVFEPVKTEVPDADVASQTLFEKSESLNFIRHEELEYNDFLRQPLLPNKYSQLGPGMAWGDIDGDGDDDLYVGGAAFSGGSLVRNSGANQFEVLEVPGKKKDIRCEDMGAIFFDVDNDDDLDLYVVSGGVERDSGDDALQDRLYLNNGKGEFSKSDWLPETRFSGGPVAAADFDRDGNVDLFVGGRIIPGAYPESPNSALLKNTGDGFEGVAGSFPDLQQAGMVTGAIWSDVNGDDWPDLLVATEWGPVKYFENQAGQLVDRTEDSGLANRIGWFNSITGGDIDNDGDIDFIVGNVGLNTKYKATEKNPAVMYYGDFEGDGRKRIVEAKFEDGVCLPSRGLSCSSHAMPMIKEKLPTYHDFATADLIGIYTEEKLADSTRYEANTLESLVILNQSDGDQVRFEIQPLPRMAQASPVYGCQLADVDLDGNLDLYVVQNFFGPQRETGYMDGGVSLLLMGSGDGKFVPLMPSKSGLVVTGDAKSLTMSDLDDDGKLDFVVGRNDNTLATFRNRSKAKSTTVRLPELAAGEQVIGGKVWIKLPNGKTRLHEVAVGSGYLSQSSPVLIHNGTIEKSKWPKPTASQ